MTWTFGSFCRAVLACSSSGRRPDCCNTGNMASNPYIPDDAAGVTAEWLRPALAAGSTGELHPVEAIQVECIGTGSGLFRQLLRCRLAWSNDAPAGPQTVIVKLHSSNPKTFRIARRLQLYRREYDYYLNMAQFSPMGSPALIYGDFEDRSHCFVLVLEDMNATHHAIESDGASPAQAKTAIRAVARLHAQYWNKVVDPRLSPFRDYLKQQRPLVQLAYLAYLPPTLNRFGHCFSEVMRRLAESYGPRIADHLEEMGAGHRTFTHGDFRSANLFLAAPDAGGLTAID